MSENSRPSNSDSSNAIDLARFGFEEDDTRWLDRFREADHAAPIGSVGPYEILEEAGRGGQGVVYRARQHGTGRVVAVKRLVAGSFSSPGARLRFDEEVRMVSSMRHPNIVTVFAMDSIEGQPVLAMEWVSGRSITNWANGDGRSTRTIREIIRLFLQVCDAVHYAHQRGVIHRDLKPQNILVDDEDRARVLDFGLARPIDALPTAPESAGDLFIGTLAYAAPEQLRDGGRDVDTRTDVHALGLILEELMTAQRPTGLAHLPIPSNTSPNDSPEAAQIRRIPSELRSIIARGRAENPADRYASVEALGADLRRYLSGDPVLAHPHRLGYVWKRRLLKHRLAFGAGFGVFVVVCACAVWAWRSAIAERKARVRESHSRAVAESVSQFLQSTLTTALPSRGGANVTLLAAIADAGKRAQRDLADDPEVAAAVEFAIGATYNALWQWREAVPHLERSVALSRSLPDLGEIQLAERLVELGRSCTGIARADAVDLQQEALALRRRAAGDQSALVAESLVRLAAALQQAAQPPKWAEAEETFKQAISIYERLSGDHRREIASCLHNYGWMRYRQQRYEEADSLYARALQIYRDIGNLKDPYYAELLHGYTSLLQLLNRYDESLAMIQEAVPLVSSVYGDSGVEPLYWRGAWANQKLNRINEAQRWYLLAMEAFCKDLAGELDDADARLRVDAIRLAIASTPDGGIPPFERFFKLIDIVPNGRRPRMNAYRRRVSERREWGLPAPLEEVQNEHQN